MSVVSWPVVRGVGVALLCCAVLGCGASSDEGAGPSVSGESRESSESSKRFSAVWHGGEYLDLESPLGSFVRAYVEDVEWALSSWDERKLSRAVVAASAFDIRDHVVSTVSSDPRPVFQGGMDHYVAEVSGPPERTQVTVCRTNSRLGSTSQSPGDGYFTRADGEPPAVFLSVLVVSQVGEAPPAGMSGGENVPPSEAFGEWQALNYEDHLSGDERADAQGKCNALLGLPPEYPDSPATYTAVPSMPEVAPSPGWPVGSTAVSGVE